MKLKDLREHSDCMSLSMNRVEMRELIEDIDRELHDAKTGLPWDPTPATGSIPEAYRRIEGLESRLRRLEQWVSAVRGA